MFDPICPSSPAVWLEYGGKVKSGTVYCCGVTATRDRPEQLVVENIPVPLIDDAYFRKLDELIKSSDGSIVHATIVGRFFAGKPLQLIEGARGYGHMGCCTLLAIQQVLSVDPHERDDLDYGSSIDRPRLDKVGCGYRDLAPLQSFAELMDVQRRAELGEQAWVFDDPKRVATEFLTHFANVDQKSVIELREKHKAPGRFVYEWSPRKTRKAYMIVVSRPYWLSFYSKDSRKVACVVGAAYESSCGKGNSVTRVS